MYNEKSKNNLISLNERTAEERAIIAKSGNKASIESKQEKKKFKDYFNSLLEEKKEIIKNGEKVKITKKEFIANKLIDILTSDKELEYKDIQAIKLLLEIIEEKPIDSLVSINNSNKLINVIDDCDKPKKANIVELKQFRFIFENEKPVYNRCDLMQDDFLIDAVLSIQLHIAELRQSGNEQQVEELIEKITDYKTADALYQTEHNFIVEVNEMRESGATTEEIIEKMQLENKLPDKLVNTYKFLTKITATSKKKLSL